MTQKILKNKVSVSRSAEHIQDVPVYRSYRYAIALVAFFGFMFVYVLRVNFSVAIVCMIRPRNVSMPTGNLTVREPSQCQDNGPSNSSKGGSRGEFDWDQDTKSRLLASFFYGYIVTQIPGGWLARRFGCRIMMGVGMFICALSTVLMPICARTTIYLVYAMRVVAGLSTGVVFPAAQCMWGRWVVPLERSTIPAFTYTGPSMGTLVTLALSGVMCQYGFDNGWASIFYVSGMCTFLWLLSWIYFVYDTPRKHPRITIQERDFIAHAIGDSYHEKEKDIKTPWVKMLTSRALWTVIITHMCSNWTQYTLITGLPSYMNEVHRFDIKTNGLLSAVPYLCAVVSGLVGARVADLIRQRGWLNTANTRRLMQSLSFFGLSIFMIAAGFVSCERRMQVIVFLALGISCHNLSKSGYLVNHLDFAPRYAGELLGFTNTAATIPGMIAPLVNGALTPNGTQEEWQKVFYLCAAFAVFGAIVFNLFVKGEIEPWAKPRGVITDAPETNDAGKKTADVEGKKTADVEGKKTADVEGKKTADVEGKKTADVEGKKTADVEGKKTADVEGKKTADVEGKKTADVEGKKTDDVLDIEVTAL